MADPATLRTNTTAMIVPADDGWSLEHWAVRDDLGLAIQAGLLSPRGGSDIGS